MCGVIIRIRRDDAVKSKNKLIAMLEDLLSIKDKELKKRIMVDEYGMLMTTELERSINMCNLSDVIEERGIKMGVEKGKIALVKTLRKLKHSDDDIISSIMEEFNFSEEEARSYL